MSKKIETQESYSYKPITNQPIPMISKSQSTGHLTRPKENMRKSMGKTKKTIPKIQQHYKQLPGTVTFSSKQPERFLRSTSTHKNR